MKKLSLAESNALMPMALGGGGLEGAKIMSREMARWQPYGGSPDMLVNGAKKITDDRSRDAMMNDGYLSGVLHSTRDSIVGASYRLIAQPNVDVLKTIDPRFDDAWEEEFSMAVEGRFNLISESRANFLDATRRDNLTGLVRLGLASHVYSGEILFSGEWIRESDRPFNTAVQLIAPDRLCNPDNGPDELRLRRGVELNMWERPIAYHIRNGYMGDAYSTVQQVSWQRVEAEKPWGRKMIVHVCERDLPGQTRGLSEMVAALKQMRMTRRFQDITLQNAVIKASYAATMESELPMEMLAGAMGGNSIGMEEYLGTFMSRLQEYMGGANNLTIDGASIPVLFPNTKLNMQQLGTPGGVGTEFEISLIRHIAASLGYSYEEFARDFSKTNYSSARAAMNLTHKRMQAKKKTIADRMASEIYDLWFEEDWNAGNLPMPVGMKPSILYAPLVKQALTGCFWIGAGRGQIDEVKETQAAIMRISAGLSTYDKEAANLGMYFKDVVRARQKEDKLIKAAGLTFSGEATKPNTNDRQQTMTDNNDTQDREEDNDAAN
ncbi:putative portal protein [Erwinia phage pEp_SNUABM_08]|uniref:Putative portal protein n=1 Tax=Erwinia phage pEp_SNUABM_08 TaxID=2593268 RepID=A0A5J6DA85_9CAUD|nr:portal protein [Erwinia phage pEp_SNUABM_08]QEQ94760.1 putative portal protein [Erwinia phage pEp_SNUABM_08]